MRVESAMLSGKSYLDDTARKMYETVADHGWDAMGAEFFTGPRGDRFEADVRVAGVSASLYLSFADQFELLAFLNAAKFETNISEQDATTAYRALALLASLATKDDDEAEATT